ncbi:hypothetical protein D3C71_1686150 [compost metagenome]
MNLPSPEIGNTGVRAMKRDNQPRCLGSNQPNISVGRSTQWRWPLATTISSCSRLVLV